MDEGVLELMRDDWNRRALEDARYYVAFGRRGQDDEEFFASAADVVRSLQAELKRLPREVAPAQRRALEIGCGPGRLMRPLSPHFGEVHGVDISNAMVRMAREKLRDVPHAHAHATAGADLSAFQEEYFDFVYSYAVFQHIPSREVVFNYLVEARRVLKTGGILRCQINGLPLQAAHYDTWNGVRIPAEEVAEFARAHDFQLLALDGVATQYMWTTWRKRPPGWHDRLTWSGPAEIRSISNAHTGEPAVPASGPYAAASLWIANLPADCDLNHLEVRCNGRPARLSYLGTPGWDDLYQLNAALPEGLPTGFVSVEVCWLAQPLCAPAWVRVILPGPLVPRVCSVSDGVDLLSGTRVCNGCVKVTFEELASTEGFAATLDGAPVRNPDWFCTDPLTRRYEVNFWLPEQTAPGPHEIRLRLGKREFAPVAIEVA